MFRCLFLLALFIAPSAMGAPMPNCDCNFTWVTEYPWPTEKDLNAIWGSGPNDIWAAGDEVLLHYDGADWSLWHQTFPNVVFTDIWGNRPDNFWVLGYVYKGSGSSKGFIARFDGVSWSRIPSPPTLDTFGTGHLPIQIIGDDGGVLCSWWVDQEGQCHFKWSENLGQWTQQCDESTQMGLFGSNTEDFWTARNRAFRFKNGSLQDLNFSYPVSYGGRNLFSHDETLLVSGYPGVFRYEGGSWSLENLPENGYGAIHGLDGNHVWVVSNDAEVYFYDGATWTFQSDHGHSDLWAAGPDNVWTVSNNGVIAHFDGNEWSSWGAERIPSFLFMGFSLPTGEAWIGNGSASSGSGDGNIFELRQGRWKVVENVNGAQVHASSSSNVWARGNKGVLHHYDGVQWREVPFAPEGQPLTALRVAAVEPDQVYVRATPHVYHWDGRSWTNVTTQQGWENFSFPNVYAVGNEVWTRTLRDPPEPGFKIVWARYDGSQWIDHPEIPEEIRSMAGLGEDDVWFGGSNLLMHWDGASFRRWDIPGEFTELAPQLDGSVFISRDALARSNDGLYRFDGFSLDRLPFYDEDEKFKVTTVYPEGVWFTDTWAIFRGHCQGVGSGDAAPPQTLLAGYGLTNLDGTGGALEMLAAVSLPGCAFAWEDLPVEVAYEGLGTGLLLTPQPKGLRDTNVYELAVPVDGPLATGSLLLELQTGGGMAWPWLTVGP